MYEQLKFELIKHWLCKALVSNIKGIIQKQADLPFGVVVLVVVVIVVGVDIIIVVVVVVTVVVVVETQLADSCPPFIHCAVIVKDVLNIMSIFAFICMHLILNQVFHDLLALQNFTPGRNPPDRGHKPVWTPKPLERTIFRLW